ncbi:MAG: polyribonucleotide nucleotidyltransferase [Candidatus Vogelbacteria bacterium]|nr:polyribonucleotide nucleotidyltransferase [Candidatus Vogelbacteria bacterium]
MQKREFSLEIEGKKLTAIFTDMADQTNGSVILKLGDTAVLATAVMSSNKREGIDFFPLVVDYEEKFYASGRILGGQFIRREGRPTEEAILSGRVVDRTIRPLFNQKIRNEVQVIVTTLSIDDENDPDILGILGASLALGTSDIPWGGPVGAVRVAQKTDGTFLINPGHTEREGALMDMTICGKGGNVNMIEAGAYEVSEDVAKQALEIGLEAIKKLEDWQKTIVSEIGKPKAVVDTSSDTKEIKDLFNAEILARLSGATMAGIPGNYSINDLKDEWLKLFKEKFPEAKNNNDACDIYEDAVNNLIHDEAVNNNRRPDGRKMDELRKISADAGVLTGIVHGCGLFYRGGTHVLSVLTLGGPKDSQLIEGAEVQERRYFMHHYNFPPFSSGETGRMGGVNRRAVGHGALAERALMATLPSRDEFPYTIRIVSESLASNGSTSMASVCASTVALMDGGVPIKRPTAGIAMGLMQTDKGYKVLTDIQGPEDHHGDMDFKVAGTREGITAIQMDVKIDGIPLEILIEALADAKKARLQILDVIEAAIPAPRTDLQPSAPRIISFTIPQDKIGGVIGPGGKIIQEMTKSTGTTIDIEQDGKVTICGKLEGVRSAAETIRGITHEYKVGEKFMGIVTRILDFGAFVSIGPGTEGLVHISELAPFRVNLVTDVVKEAEKVPVIIKEVDERGRINLSIRQADPDFAKNKGVVPPPPGSMPPPRPPHIGPPRPYGRRP